MRPAALLALSAVAAGAFSLSSAEESVLPPDWEAMWDGCWSQGLSLDEIEARFVRVDAFLVLDIVREAAARGKSRARLDAFVERWRAAARQGDVARLQDMVCSAAVRFAPAERIPEWLERASLDPGSLRRWILSRLDCPVLKGGAVQGGEALERARAHLDHAGDCPRCRGAEIPFLRACLSRLASIR